MLGKQDENLETGIMPACYLRWPLPQAASGAHLILIHLLQPASWVFLTVNLRPASKPSYRQAVWMGVKLSLRFTLAPLLVQLRKLWPLHQENPDLLFSGVVFVYHLCETDPLVTGFALGQLGATSFVALDVKSW